MHPWMAVWIWSMTVSRVWQNALSQQGLLADNENTRADTGQRPLPIIVNASDYLKTDIVEQILPDLILDRLAELHWMEREPALAI
jgi:hypothetical protein